MYKISSDLSTFLKSVIYLLNPSKLIIFRGLQKSLYVCKSFLCLLCFKKRVCEVLIVFQISPDFANYNTLKENAVILKETFRAS